jgi:Cu2+-exporting ATPase
VLANSGGVQAVLLFDDPLRPGIKAMLAGLKDSGVRHLAILSGDARATVMRLARQLGIEDAHGGLSPADKLAWTQAQQAQGRQLAMFGDGINDAPTLAAADVSISFADATDLANASSDFLILGDDAGALLDARRLARRTRRNIQQSLSWAVAYNLLAVPFAAAGWIPPWGAAIGMSVSSLLVVMNALRLQRK